MPNAQGYIDPYDNRIGSGSTPAGISGSANRAYTYTPTEGQTSMGLLNKYTQHDTPLLRNARTRAGEYSAQRGMLNSSIAAGNAERAGIESAGQFALTDAGHMNNAMLKNVDVLNDREAERAAAASLSSVTGLINSAGDARNASEREAQLQLQRERLAFEGEQQQLDRVTGADMARMGYDFDTGLENLRTGNQRILLGDQYGYNRGMENLQSDNRYNNDSRLADQDAYNRAGLSRQEYEQQLWTGMVNRSMEQPEIMGNPEGFNNFASYAMRQGPNGRHEFLDRNSYFNRPRSGG